MVARFDEEHSSSDGGAVLLKAADRKLGLIERCGFRKFCPVPFRKFLPV
jgi:hypothetical protein